MWSTAANSANPEQGCPPHPLCEVSHSTVAITPKPIWRRIEIGPARPPMAQKHMGYSRRALGALSGQLES